MFICKNWNLQMYSIGKFYYTTITMKKEGTACLKTKQTKNTTLTNTIFNLAVNTWVKICQQWI